MYGSFSFLKHFYRSLPGAQGGFVGDPTSLARDNILNTVNSPIRAQCAQTEHRCAPIWKVEVGSFPTVYDNPYFALYRHVIYRWKAFDLSLKDLNRVGAPLLEVRPYWRIYGSFSIFQLPFFMKSQVLGVIQLSRELSPGIHISSETYELFPPKMWWPIKSVVSIFNTAQSFSLLYATEFDTQASRTLLFGGNV